ncbi:hypothetical protein J1N09_14600 [Aureitalea sp. L0-47]|uniref:hypothetical protein n=1 Tax=Aureitalea sp. L0-47 TaxID=2816962 RepID=UPI002238AE24|nr:hypothetical protein [Aureitalea sp. L0-47]MCW5521077.1 hypothetical protein [Aureitalea sp. L0-47]
MIKDLIRKLRSVERGRLLTYIIVYFAWGILMHHVGQWLEIAKFTFWWQVISTYILYMVPISILLRGYPFFTQYAYGLVAMAALEFGGYALGTSYIYPDNILEKWFTPHTFALAMAIFFALYFPIGNWVVNRIYLLFSDKNSKK